MKELFLDNVKVDLQEELTQTVDTQFLDSYQPEALIGAHSKTVTLPGTAKNNAIFANQKERYEATVWENGSRVLYGYATLDKVKKQNQETYYDVTLYTMLGEFFSNLKGTDREPKDLADLYYGFYGFNPNSETRTAPLFTLDEFFVHNSWLVSGSASDSSTQEATFQVVPCNFDQKNFDRERLLFNETNASLRFFKTGSDDGSGSYFVSGSDKFVVVEMEENTPYAMMNVPINNMPIGTRYRKVIEACTRPVNNGGFTVNLDPDWFNNDNPYWTELFIMNTQPGMEIDYTADTVEGSPFTYPHVTGTGQYAVSASADLSPWTAVGGVLTTSQIVENCKVEFKFLPEIYVNNGYVRVWAHGGPNNQWQENQSYYGGPGSTINCTYDPHTTGCGNATGSMTLPYYNVRTYNSNNMQVKLIVKDATTNAVLGTSTWNSTNKEFKPNPYVNNGQTRYYVLADGEQTLSVTFGGQNLSGDTQNQIKVQIEVSGTMALYPVPETIASCHGKTPGCSLTIYFDAKRSTSSGWTQHSYSQNWPNYLNYGSNKITLETKYSAAGFQSLVVEPNKEQLLGGMGTPLDWFIKYLRMFNLRVYCHPDSKIIDVMTLDNYINKFEPEDLTGRLDYSQEYTSEKKVIDESYIKWEVTPNKNESTERWQDAYGDTMLDREVGIKKFGVDTYDYLNTEVKVGTVAQKDTPFLTRVKTGAITLGGDQYRKYLFGINQKDPLEVHYVDPNTGEDFSSEYHAEIVRYHARKSEYGVLELNDDIPGTLVMRQGWNIIVREDCITTGGSCSFVKLPFMFYRPSAGMVRAAGKPCYLGGYADTGTHSDTWQNYGTMYGCPYGIQLQFPVFSNVAEDGSALTYTPMSFERINNSNDIYSRCFENFINRVYLDPETVKCSAFLVYPETRKLYFFENKYWILSKVEEWVGPDKPCKCTFVKYTVADLPGNVPTVPVPEPITDSNIIGTAIIGPTFIIG